MTDVLGASEMFKWEDNSFTFVDNLGHYQI